MSPLFAIGALLLMIGLVFHLVYSTWRRGDLGRNRAVGIRTRATLRSDEAWQAGHRAAAPVVLATVISAYAGAGVCVVVGLLTSGDPVNDAQVGVIVAVSLGSFLVLTLYSARVANRAARAVSGTD